MRDYQRGEEALHEVVMRRLGDYRTIATPELATSVEHLIDVGYPAEQIFDAIGHIDRSWPRGDIIVSTAELSGKVTPLNVFTITADRHGASVQWGGLIKCIENSSFALPEAGQERKRGYVEFQFTEKPAGGYTDLRFVGEIPVEA